MRIIHAHATNYSDVFLRALRNYIIEIPIFNYSTNLIACSKKAGKIGLLITGIAATGYGIYKLAPYVKSKIHKPKQNQETDDTYCDHHTNNTVTE